MSYSFSSLQERLVRRLLIILTVLYVLTALAMAGADLSPAVPWSFVLLLVMGLAPAAYLLVECVDRVEPSLSAFPRGPAALLAVLLGLAAVYWFTLLRDLDVCLPLMIVALADLARRKRGLVRQLVAPTVILFIGYSAVWNVNYLVVKYGSHRLCDATLLQWDLAWYSQMSGSPVACAGLFPRCRSLLAFRMFENGYFMLFIEIMVVILDKLRRRESVTEFLGLLFACYLTGSIIFAVAPSVGPFTYSPETIHPDMYDTSAYRLMQSVTNDFQAVLRGNALNGYGYFAAVPSLHVAMALLLQMSLWKSRFLFWMFLPVNLLLCASTVVLGFHYLVDVPAGLLLTVAVLTAWKACRLSQGAPEAPARECVVPPPLALRAGVEA